MGIASSAAPEEKQHTGQCTDKLQRQMDALMQMCPYSYTTNKGSMDVYKCLECQAAARRIIAWDFRRYVCDNGHKYHLHFFRNGQVHVYDLPDQAKATDTCHLCRIDNES